jgi:AraC-like DNA-binding protein
VPIAIPWPRDRRLVAVCSAIMADPGSSKNIEQWAGDVGASARTLIACSQGDRPALPAVGAAGASGRSAWAAGTGPAVGEIAAALGYASPSAFSAMFRRILGKTPQHYLTEWRTLTLLPA